jgi:hypothetical protein
MVADIVERLSGRKVARQIFCGLSTHRQGGSHFEVEALGEFTLQGFSPPNYAYNVLKFAQTRGATRLAQRQWGIYLPDDPEESPGE